MRKINLVIIHESHKSRDEISLILKKNFPLINIIDTYNTNSVDLSKSIRNNADLFLISSKVDLTLNKNIIEKIKTNSEFILYPFTLEKFLYSINKYYWKFFLKLNK